MRGAIEAAKVRSETLGVGELNEIIQLPVDSHYSRQESRIFDRLLRQATMDVQREGSPARERPPVPPDAAMGAGVASPRRSRVRVAADPGA